MCHCDDQSVIKVYSFILFNISEIRILLISFNCNEPVSALFSAFPLSEVLSANAVKRKQYDRNTALLHDVRERNSPYCMVFPYSDSTDSAYVSILPVAIIDSRSFFNVYCDGTG